jgi:hypothetical protein
MLQARMFSMQKQKKRAGGEGDTTLPVKVALDPIVCIFPPTLSFWYWFKSKNYESQSLLHLV